MTLLTSNLGVRNLRATFIRPISLFSIKFSLRHETHISAKPHKAKTHSRISGSHVYPCRTFGTETASRKRPGGIVSLNRLRNYRLSRPADFDRLFRDNHRSGDAYFTVLYRPNGLGYSRLGLAIAKKTVRRAVARNRLKRVVRESFRIARRQLNSLDIVIMARHKAEATANAELFTSLDDHWLLLSQRTKH